MARHLIQPWHRWVLIVTVMAKDYTAARKQLHIGPAAHAYILNQLRKKLGVQHPTHMMLKLGLMKIDFNTIPEWVGSTEIHLPGYVIDLEGDDNGKPDLHDDSS